LRGLFSFRIKLHNAVQDSAPAPTPATVSQKLKKPCARLVDIPDRDLTQEEWNKLAALDAALHGACIRKDDKLIKAAEALEHQGQKP
jgi:hypothetical protein